MNMNEIAVICDLVNYRSFCDAAYSLSYSPSVITKYVSNMEKELGVKLFVRSRKASELLPTPEGQVLITAMRRIDSDYQYLLEIAKQLRSSNRKQIRVGSQPRYGNLHEQDIVASFLMENSGVELQMVKLIARDLIGMLKAGKLDAAFITLHGNLNIDEYLREKELDPDVGYSFITSECEMYFGVSEKYMPGVTEARFRDFRDFTFAFPFPKLDDSQEKMAASTFSELARDAGMKLRSMHVEGYDNTIFRLATRSPVAICTVNIPAQYEGIKFVRVTDWHGYSRLYFVYLKNSRNEMLRRLLTCVNSFIKENPPSEA